MNRLEQIFIKRMKRGPMDPVQKALVVAGKGIVGNANQGGKRQVTIIDEARWRDEWHHHVDRVRAHFAGRDDLLEIDLAACGGWRPICELLGVAEPGTPFPWVNRGPTHERAPR